MAKYLLRNILNPNKVVGCTITFRQLVNKGEEGEPVWVVEIRTVEPHKNGGGIPPEFVHLTSLDNLDLAIKEATENIAAKVDWEPLVDDTRAPLITYNTPEDGDVADIYSNVSFIIEDLIPSAGIDLSSITMTVNGFDVTGELQISGGPYKYTVIWKPFKRVLDTY